MMTIHEIITNVGFFFSLSKRKKNWRKPNLLQ